MDGWSGEKVWKGKISPIFQTIQTRGLSPSVASGTNDHRCAKVHENGNF